MKKHPSAARLARALMMMMMSLTSLLLATPGQARPSPRCDRLPRAPLVEKQAWPSRPLLPRRAPAIHSLANAEQGTTLEARLLVVSADGNEPGLGTIRQVLDYLGTPYTLHVALQRPGGLTPDLLATGTQGHFQGIILATSSLGYFDGAEWRVALSLAEWQALADYERRFGVRQVTWYTYPTAELGFSEQVTPRDTTQVPLELAQTDQGKALFPYLVEKPIPVRHSYTYLARAAAGSTTLLQDEQGHSLAVIASLPDGRENLALTFDGNPHLVHSIALSHGVVGWVTRGLFLGYRRVFIGVQVDDLFLDNDIWNLPETETFRITGKDLEFIAKWQGQAQGSLHSPDFRLDLAYNGLGTVAGEYPGDTLTPTARKLAPEFKWISHTFTHPYLDTMDYASVSEEISANLRVATQLKLERFSAKNLVTPNITGLYNLEAMRAAYDQGVRYVVSDTSMPGQGMSIPNAALRNFVLPEMLMIPRRPTNLFYNVSTPEQWTGEYNTLYRSYWGRDLLYEEILEEESHMLLRYLLKGELAPWMFHQANLRDYAKERSLLTDLLDRTFEKYRALYKLPLLSPPMDVLGQHAERRLAYSEAQVSTRLLPGQALLLTSSKDIVVPVTGATLSCSERYGSEATSFIQLRAGQEVRVPLNGTDDSHICGP